MYDNLPYFNVVFLKDDTIVTKKGEMENE